MAKFLTLFLTTAAAIGLAQAQAQCPSNAVLCGSTIIDDLQCSDAASLAFLTPKGNDPRDCAFPTSADGLPQGRGTFCCTVGRCVQNGLSAFCD